MDLLTLDLHLGPPQNSGVNIPAEVKLYLYSYFSSAPCLRVFSCKLVLSAFDVSTPSLITCLPLVPPSYFSQGSFFHFDFVLLPLFTFIIFVIFAKFFFFSSFNSILNKFDQFFSLTIILKTISF